MNLWQLTVPGFLEMYDTGVYVAATMHFTSGSLPYRDFFFVQPPGIVLLMSPIGLFSRIFGTHDAFELVRVISSFVTALDAVLVAWLVRHRGRCAMLVAGAGLALMPVAVYVSSGLRLEPYCICGILLASLVVISDRSDLHHLTDRQLIVAGILMGLATLIKLWALFPLLALVICLVPSCRKRVLLLITAAVAAFVVPSLPFFLAAPRNFISEVFIDQVFRKADASTGAQSLLWRLSDLTGFSFTSIAPDRAEVVVGFVAFIGVVILAFSRRVQHEVVDVFLLLSAATTVGALLIAPEYLSYYGYFASPFLLGLLAVSLSRLGPPARQLARHLAISPLVRRLIVGASALSSALLVVALVAYVTTFYSFGVRWGVADSELRPVAKYIPAGSCVIYSDVAYGVYTNRLLSSHRDCPIVIDPVGLWMAWGYQLVPPAPGFVSQWKSDFEAAQYVVLPHPTTGPLAPFVNRWQVSEIPWNQSLLAWFSLHYHLTFGRGSLYIYEHDSGTRR
jgi:hypothetical protein